MRHGKKFNHLSRKVGHRRALLKNMASSLIKHKRINTTLAKAKELRKYAEPIINRAKNDSMNNRRLAFRDLQDKDAVKALFAEVADKVANRNGGYTRIIRLGARLGDNAELAMIELVDFNELYTQSKETKKTKRRRRKGGKSTSEAEEQPIAEETEEVIAEASTDEVKVETEAIASTEEDTSEDTSANEAEADGNSEEDKKD